MTIAKTLVEAASCSPVKGENRQGFLRRLVGKIDALPEDQWKALPEAAQKWVNKATEAIEGGKDIEEPEGLDGVLGTSAGTAAPAETGKGKKPAAAKKSASKAPAKKTAAKPAKKGAAKAAGGKKKAGGRPRIDDDAKLHWKKKLPEKGMRNQYAAKAKEGTTVKELRKDRKVFKAMKFWRRKGYVELVGA